MSRWELNNLAQRKVRDAILCPHLYGKYSMQGRYVCIDKGALATKIQKRFAVDIVLQSKRNGAAVFIEEKIVRWHGKNYQFFTLETKSCTVPGHESPGWMEYGEADLLNYVMCQEDGDPVLVCYLIEFPKLKEAFQKEDQSKFMDTITDQENKTLCKMVSISWVRENVGFFSRGGNPIYINLNENEMRIVKEYNKGHYKNQRRAEWPVEE